ncbi:MULTISPECIES: hypothetical protein [Hyphobacterium]|uniref:DUF1131 domain-containing protein n=1 Tax=Hyphobacterium vulgare TaxID=1736751 RepID=A0ABV6ZY85_9PROT
MKYRHMHLIIPALALMAAGCSDSATPETEDAASPAASLPDGSTTAEPQGGAVSDDPDPDATRAWEITARAFGPFDPATPYTSGALAAALPGYDLVESELESEGSPYPVTMAVPRGASEPVIVVAGIPGSDLIFAVAVRERDKIANPAGRIGQTYGEAQFEGMACWPGAEERSGNVVCLDPRNSAVGYWLRPEGYEGPDGELPPAEILANAVIYEIRWTPPAE